MRGKFITVEGIEGVGKSTVVPYIESLLQEAGFNVCVTREPGGTVLAESIRQLLLSDWDEGLLPQTELLLMFASRSQHSHVVIEPNLEAGNWVLCERFTDASVAYQGGGRNIPRRYIESLASLAHGKLWPDLTLYLDMDVNGTVRRTHGRVKDRIEQEDLEFFQRVRNAYLELASHESRIVAIDANNSLASVQSDISAALQKFLP